MASSSSTIYPDQVDRLEAYIPAICRIVRIADNRPLGTGFLIAPGVVATCHHVVPKLAKPGECRAEFYGAPVVDQSDLSTRKVVYFEAISFDPDESRCVTSPQNFDKNGKLLAADSGKLDYSILSLMTNPKLVKVKYFDLFHACTGPMIEQLSSAFVFQHPDIESRDASGLWIKSHDLPSSTNSKKKTKKIWTRGEFNLATGPLRTCGEYEIHYAPETSPGSSGGPVTDAMGNLIALHYQGEVYDCGCARSSTEPAYCNAGVRIDKILEDLGKEELGQTKKQKIEALINENSLRNHLRLFAHFKEYYQKQRTALLTTQGENWLFPIDEVYRDLAIIKKPARNELKGKGKSFEVQQRESHEEQYHSESLNIRDLFQEEELKGSQKRIIVYGAAGIGKTTFSEWATIHGPKIWPDQFKHIFLIKLRNLNSTNYPNLGKDYSDKEVLAKEYGISLQESKDTSSYEMEGFSCSQEELNEFLRHSSVKNESLLILDGFDELPTEALNGQGALKNVIKGLEQTFNNIAITSRNCDVRFFNNLEMNWKAQFEITGFNQKSIRGYIKRFYKQLEKKSKIQLGSSAEDKIIKLRAVLKNNTILNHFVHIPINLALTCTIFNTNEALFESFENYSLASFYREAVNLLYDKFLRRPGPMQSVAHTPQSDLTLHVLMSPKHQILQRIAWLAMKKGKVQIGEDDVQQAFEKRTASYDADLIKDIGIIKFENGVWEFIHLTFQEYFAGLYLANVYIDACRVKKEKRPKRLKQARKKIAKIKLNQRYRLTLAMAAGYLSFKATESSDNQRAQQAFFEHLLNQPRDLTNNYEPFILSECFEECTIRANIQSYYSTFIEYYASCLNAIEDETVLFELLNGKNKLFHDDEVIRLVILQLEDPNRVRRMIQVLLKLASTRQIFPKNLLDHLRVTAQKAANDEDDLLRATIRILEVLAGRNTSLALEARNVLQQLLLCDLPVKIEAARALGRLSKEGGDIPVYLEDLLLTIRNSVSDLNSQVDLTFALIAIAKRKKEGIPGEAHLLITLAQNETIEEYQRKDLIDAIGTLLKDEGPVPQDILDLLFSMLEQPSFTDRLTSSLITVLRRAVKEGDGFLENKVRILMEQVKNLQNGSPEKINVQQALTNLGRVGGGMTEIILNGLITILQDRESPLSIRAYVADILTKISEEGRLVGSRCVDRLIGITQDLVLLEGVGEKVLLILGNIAKEDGPSGSQAIRTLVTILEDPRYGDNLKKSALSMLAKISNRVIPIKDLSVVMTMLEGADDEVKLNVLELLKKIVPSIESISLDFIQTIMKMIEDSQLDHDLQQISLIDALLSVLKKNVKNHPMAVLADLTPWSCIASNEGLTPALRKKAMSQLESLGESYPSEQAKEAINIIKVIANNGNLPPEIRRDAERAIIQIARNNASLGLNECDYLLSMLQSSELTDQEMASIGEVIETALKDKNQSNGLIQQNVIDHLQRLMNSPDCKDHVKIIMFYGLIAVNESAVSPELLEQCGALIQSTSVDHFRIALLGVLILSGIAREDMVNRPIAVKILYDLLQKPNLHNEVRMYAGFILGILADDDPGIPINMLDSILQSVFPDPGCIGWVEAASGLGKMVKKGGKVSQASLDCIIDLLHDSLVDNEKGRIIHALANIVEQGGEIARQALHALCMRLHQKKIEYIEHALKKISVQSLLKLITDGPSCHLVFLVCVLTSRTFASFEGTVYLGDDQELVSKEIVIEGIEQMNGLEGPLVSRSRSNHPSSSSCSSSSSSSHTTLSSLSGKPSSSSSQLEQTPATSGALISEGHLNHYTAPILSVQIGDPYLRLDEIFKSVYQRVLSDDFLSSLMVNLIDPDPASHNNSKSLLVDYLVSECAKAASQDHHFRELKEKVPYMALVSLEKMAHYYSIRKSSWIEKALEKIGHFSQVPPFRASEALIDMLYPFIFRIGI